MNKPLTAFLWLSVALLLYSGSSAASSKGYPKRNALQKARSLSLDRQNSQGKKKRRLSLPELPKVLDSDVSAERKRGRSSTRLTEPPSQVIEFRIAKTQTTVGVKGSECQVEFVRGRSTVAQFVWEEHCHEFQSSQGLWDVMGRCSLELGFCPIRIIYDNIEIKDADMRSYITILWKSVGWIPKQSFVTEFPKHVFEARRVDLDKESFTEVGKLDCEVVDCKVRSVWFAGKERLNQLGSDLVVGYPNRIMHSLTIHHRSYAFYLLFTLRPCTWFDEFWDRAVMTLPYAFVLWKKRSNELLKLELSDWGLIAAAVKGSPLEEAEGNQYGFALAVSSPETLDSAMALIDTQLHKRESSSSKFRETNKRLSRNYQKRQTQTPVNRFVQIAVLDFSRFRSFMLAATIILAEGSYAEFKVYELVIVHLDYSFVLLFQLRHPLSDKQFWDLAAPARPFAFFVQKYLSHDILMLERSNWDIIAPIFQTSAVTEKTETSSGFKYSVDYSDDNPSLAEAEKQLDKFFPRSSPSSNPSTSPKGVSDKS